MRFVVHGEERRLGLLHADAVLDLPAAARARHGHDDPVFDSLLSLIEADRQGLDLAAELLDEFGGSDRPGLNVPVAETRLVAPFPGRRFALSGSNNAAHVAAYHRSQGRASTPEAVRESTREGGRAGGFWSVTEPVGPGADVPLPRTPDGYFDYEGEVAVVLGRGGKRLDEADWESRIWGSVLLIDWSLRSPSLPLPWYGHKNFDAGKSLGPWISVGELDPLKVVVETRVNGEVRQRFTNGEDMIYSYTEILAQLSENLTLLPGDLLAGGTGPGTVLDSTPLGPDRDDTTRRDLRRGDRIEVSAEGLGVLSATVVASDD